METRLFPLIIVAVTAVINVFFAFGGITTPLNCTIGTAIQQVHAAVIEGW